MMIYVTLDAHDAETLMALPASIDRSESELLEACSEVHDSGEEEQFKIEISDGLAKWLDSHREHDHSGVIDHILTSFSDKLARATGAPSCH